MKIARVEMLYLIWVLPVLFLFFLYGMRRRQGILHRFASEKGLDAIVFGRSSKPRWIKAALILLSLMGVAAALSGPQYGYRWQEIERKGIDIIIALDCSRSMLAKDIPPSRLDRAKREVYDLLNLLQGDRIGLVAFAGTAFLQCPLTLDYGAFHLFLETLTPDYLPVGGSDIPAAMAAALSGFDAKGSREKAVILITDGENTGAGNPLKAAEDAREAGVKLFCIGVGTGEGVPVPDPEGGFVKDRSGKIVVSRLAEETLQKAAVATGGTYVKSIAGDMDLDVIYTREIRGGMEMETMKGGRKQVWEDRYQWVLFLAVAALIAELFLASGKKTGGPAGLMIVMLLVLATATPARADALRDGASAYGEDNYETALKHFIDAQLDAPDDPEVLYNIGNTYYRLKDFDSAAKSFEAAIASGDQRIRHDALYNLGNANFRRQDFKQAAENYEAVLKMTPEDRDASENLELARKKMMEKQQKQQSSQKKSASGKDDQQSPDAGKSGSPEGGSGDEENKTKPSPREESSGEQNASERPSPDVGEEKNGDPDRESLEQPDRNDGDQVPEPSETNAGSPNGEEKDAMPSERSDAGEAAGGGEGGQAEKMLNRLKDQPGRALMPGYGKRQVDQDW